MAAKMITITKKGKEAEVVETSLHVWKERGWTVKGASKSIPSTPDKSTSTSDKSTSTTGSKESATS